MTRLARVAFVIVAAFGMLSPSTAVAAPMERQPAAPALDGVDLQVSVLVYGGTPSGVIAAVSIPAKPPCP